MHRLIQVGRGTIIGVALAMLAGAAPVVSAPQTSQSETRAETPAGSPIETATILAIHPHDPAAFTQGLFFSEGHLFESTGQRGESAIREVDLATGKVKREARLPAQYFGEGSTGWRGTIVSLTWRHGIGFRWDRKTFRQTGTFRYTGEGWGLTHDGSSLILSDGTAELRFLNPETMAERRRIRVTWNGQPVDQLNELEFVRGEVLANIWHTDLIARIDPASGVIKGFIDLSAVTATVVVRDSESVLNGIAYDAKAGKLYVTGKRWPKLFEIALP
ncbi:glutaminyl-peptide cyclotransferase [Sphingomonas sp. LT1P40]|uniref:glutaminyl-peptide cyclotransferase n=1 Tax=Alteristakelama amylovorans TaxID=3096166 RepID=UPI002FC8851E